MNKVGIHYGYWTQNWCGDFPYYIKKVANLGFDILELSTDCLLDMSKSKLDEIKKTADENGIELTYCVGFTGDKDLASEDNTIRQEGIKYALKTLETIHYMKGNVFGGINYSSWPKILNEGIYDKSLYLERSINSIKEVIKTKDR